MKLSAEAEKIINSIDKEFIDLYKEHRRQQTQSTIISLVMLTIFMFRRYTIYPIIGFIFKLIFD